MIGHGFAQPPENGFTTARIARPVDSRQHGFGNDDLVVPFDGAGRFQSMSSVSLRGTALFVLQADRRGGVQCIGQMALVVDRA